MKIWIQVHVYCVITTSRKCRVFCFKMALYEMKKFLFFFTATYI